MVDEREYEARKAGERQLAHDFLEGDGERARARTRR